jgi:hypothetical protein
VKRRAPSLLLRRLVPAPGVEPRRRGVALGGGVREPNLALHADALALQAKQARAPLVALAQFRIELRV